MAIAFRAAGSVVGANSGNVAGVTLPIGHTANDLLLLYTVAHDNVSQTVAGFTQLANVTNGATMTLYLFAKFDNGAESAPTVTHAAGGTIHAVICAYSGVSTSLTLGTGAGAVLRDFQSTNGSGTGTLTVTAPTISGVVAGDMEVNLNAHDSTDTSGGITVDWTPTSGFTERTDTGRIGATSHNNSEWAEKVAGTVGTTSASGNLNGAGGTIQWIGSQSAISSDTGAAGAVKKTFTPIPFLTGH